MKSHAYVVHVEAATMSEHEKKEIHLFQIATQMKVSGLSDHFIVSSVRVALVLDGLYDLMKMWEAEKNKNERDEIIADIQEVLDDSEQKGVTELTSVRLNDLDAVSKNIRAFKDSLLTKVVENGGISRLSESTGIPQPSLSRFFNTNTMPRRATLLKIAKALKLDELKIVKIWR